jgi:predicted phage-related endonuclease
MVGKVTPNTMLSASRVPALLGHSKYETPNGVLTSVINALQDAPEHFETNEAMHWGNLLEVPLLLEASARLGLSHLVLDHPKPYFHPDAPIACSLDGQGDGNGLVVSDNPDAGVYVVGAESITLDGVGVLEAKVTSVYPEDYPALSRGPLQLQAQMDITGAKWGAVCVLYQGTELRIFLFAPHEETQALIRAKAREFETKLTHWTETGEVDWYDPATPAEYGTKWPGDANLDSVDLGQWGATLAERIVKAKELIKTLETTITEDETELKELLGNATLAHAEEFRISWPIRNYQAQPEKVVPAKPAHSMRQSTITIKGPK